MAALRYIQLKNKFCFIKFQWTKIAGSYVLWQYLSNLMYLYLLKIVACIVCRATIQMLGVNFLVSIEQTAKWAWGNVYSMQML